MLLHNGNKFPSFPLVHAVHMQEIWENLQDFLQKRRFEYHRWNICADLNVTVLVTVLQGRFTKFCLLKSYDAHLATAPQHIPTQHDMLPQHLVCKYQLNCEYYNITLARN